MPPRGPPDPHERTEQASEAVLASLAREGLLRPARVGPGSRPRTPPPREKLSEILAELDADRRER